MHTRTYADKEVIKATRQFLCVKIDPGTSGWARKAAERWKIGVERKGGTFDYPVALVLSGDLSIVGWRQGFVEPPEFASFLFASAASSAGPEGGGKPKPGPAAVAWEASYEAALDTASLEGKPILLAFLDSGSDESGRMEKEAFGDAAVAELSAGFACARVDPSKPDDLHVAESYRADVEKAGVRFAFPLVVIMTKDLDFVSARSWPSAPAEIAAMMAKALGK